MSTPPAQQVLTSVEPEHDRVAARGALAEDKIVEKALATQAHIACRGSDVRCELTICHKKPLTTTKLNVNQACVCTIIHSY